MRRHVAVVALFLTFLTAGPVLASHSDGIDTWAEVSPEGVVTLFWTGGQPNFTIYRSTSAMLVVDRANQIGISAVRSWADSPPAGPIFFYEITSPCVFAPPEVCDAVDNDCDGETDEPGAEASCNLANASPACVAGQCAIAQCNPGHGDCDGAATNGCETDTHVAQSNSPASLWAGDPDPDKDLAPGYQRVAAITNCGGCSNISPAFSCDDGTSCTTDLCVPVGPAGSQIGVCRRYSRAQCSEARCGGLTLPPGTPVPGDAGCTGMDSDGDGLSDAWETPQVDPYDLGTDPAGVDINCNGIIDGVDDDMIWHEPPSPAIKDIYLKYDYMAPGPGESSGHAPPVEAVAEVVSAFARQGINLHIDPNHQALPHADAIYLPVQGADPCAVPGSVNFYDIKNNPANFDQRRRFFYHYAIIGHGSCSSGAPASDGSGGAEIGGQDFIVSLGTFEYSGTIQQAAKKQQREYAGTLMHEMGHNLGLCHGGPVDPNASDPCDTTQQSHKPNQISSMDYLYQLSGIQRSSLPGVLTPLDPNLPRRVDFSHQALVPLDEADLDETMGIGGLVTPFNRDIARYFCSGSGAPVSGPAGGPVDWNCDGFLEESASEDLDNSGTLEILQGAAEWSKLDFRFQCQPTAADAPLPSRYVTRAELTLQKAESLGLRAGPTAYCDPGFDDCDGNPANGCETPVGDDPDNCGGCGMVCSGNNISRSCYAGACLGTCDPGFGDCNSNKRSDGCETDLNSDPGSCGTCGLSCAPTGDTCRNGTCACGTQPSCDTLFCTLGASCSGGSCTGGTPRDCSTGVACAVGSCNESTNKCDVTCTELPCWSTPVAGGTGSAPASDTSFSPAGPSYQYVAKGTVLYALRNVAEGGAPAGSIKWVWTAPAPIQNSPTPVPAGSAGSGAEFIFASSDNGVLYKIDASNGSMMDSVDTRRPVCPSDRLTATPAVQLYAFSNATFRSDVDSVPGHGGDDVVFVVTNNQCGDTTHNRVFAYWASDLTPKWIFNAAGSTMVDAVLEGCSIDYDTNMLYCGTQLASAGGPQNSLWAIETPTGQVKWATNAGSILNRPMLNTGPNGKRLYVASQAGALDAFLPLGNPTGGAIRPWSTPVSVVTPGAAINLNIWPEFRPGWTHTRIFVVDSAGTLRSIRDNGSTGLLEWSQDAEPGVQWITMPVFSPATGKIYLGRDDGRVQQVTLDGNPEGVVQAAAGPGDTMIFDPSVDALGLNVNRLTVSCGVTAAGSQVIQFCLPLSLSAPF